MTDFQWVQQYARDEARKVVVEPVRPDTTALAGDIA